jgi:hypothetical protein
MIDVAIIGLGFKSPTYSSLRIDMLAEVDRYMIEFDQNSS